MSPADFKMLQHLLDNPVHEVERSVFRDKHGEWAKEWMQVVDIYIEFDNASEYHLSPGEFKALTREQKNKIRHAPSSPLP